MNEYVSLSDDRDVLVLIRRELIAAVYVTGGSTRIVLTVGGIVSVKESPERVRVLLQGTFAKNLSRPISAVNTAGGADHAGG